MAKVSKVLEWLSARDPEELIALEGWWYQSDVENNNNVKLTEEQWDYIVTKFEKDTSIHIDDVVSLTQEKFDVETVEEN